MTYIAIAFPDKIALGAQRDTDWATTVHRTFAGWTQRNQNRSRALHSWDISFAVRVVSDYDAIVEHFHQVRGRANLFPFKDYLDFTAAQAEGLLTLVSGSIYQMHKRYGAANPFDRKITRPRSGTVTVYRTRSAVTTTITPTIDYTTGRVTVAGHVAGDTYAWAGEFMVPCRYDADRLPGAIINRQPGAAGEHFVQCESILVVEEFE